VSFHLDPLWGSGAIDAIGVDAYFPLSDWRDGETHSDADIADDNYDLKVMIISTPPELIGMHKFEAI